jgi:hypothetical protein
MAGQNREASRYRQASARLTALGRDDTQTAGITQQLGRRLLGSDDPGSGARLRVQWRSAAVTKRAECVTMLLRNYADALHDPDRFVEAADYAGRLCKR